MRKILGVIIWCMILLAGCARNNAEEKENGKTEEVPQKEAAAEEETEEEIFQYEVQDYSRYFDGMDGAAVFLDVKEKTYFLYNEEGCEKRNAPFSTFKIISTLAALEKEADLSDISYDGIIWPRDEWNKDIELEEAFRVSCVWYYRSLIDKVGRSFMQSFLDEVDYGNRDISKWEGSGFNKNPAIDGFWLDSSLQISPLEQVNVLHKIFEGETRIKEEHINQLKTFMYDDESQLYGKTGSGAGGWYTGFLEKGENIYFAVYLEPHDEAKGAKAKEIAGNIVENRFN